MKSFTASLVLLSMTAPALALFNSGVSEMESSKKESISITADKNTVAGTQQHKTQAPAKTGPASSKRVALEPNAAKAEYEQYLNEQISQLESLQAKFATSKNRGEVWLRLAEAYSEKSKLIDYKKQNEYDAALQAYQAGQSRVAPSLDLSEAKSYAAKAVRVYEKFVHDFPKDERIPQAYFFLGFNYFELEQPQKAVDNYKSLVEMFPTSKFASEAHFALGDFWFENEKWDKAFAEYREAMKDHTGRFYVFAHYKSAWALFRMGKYAEALKSMEIMIQLAQIEEKKQVGGFKMLHEGLKDIVLFYVEAGDVGDAEAFFKKVGGSDWVVSYEKLGYLYADKGNLTSAFKIFKHLIQINPSAPKAFDYQYKIVDLYQHSRDVNTFKKELFYWAKEFGPTSVWYDANKSNSELAVESQKLLEATLRNWTLQQHQTAQNSRAALSQSLAQDGYTLYLSMFERSAHGPEMHFYYGELLYDMQKFDPAAQEYLWVVNNGTATQLIPKALDNYLICYERQLPKDAQISARVGKGVEPIALDATSERYVAASAWYVQKNASSEKALESQFRVARLYYMHNQFDEAVKRFRDIINAHPNSKYAEYSANLILDIYNLKKDYSGLEKIGKELLAIPAIASSKVGAEIRAVIEKSSFKRAQNLEGGHDFLQAAQQFETFSEQNLNTALGASALFNAAVNYEKAASNGAAISAYSRIISSNDPHMVAHKVKSEMALAKLYQDTGQLEMAADLYQKAGEHLGADPKSSNYFFNAAVLFEALGRSDKADPLYRKYIAQDKSPDRFESLFTMAEMYYRERRYSTAAQYYVQYINVKSSQKDKIALAMYKARLCYAQDHRDKEANAMGQKNIEYYKAVHLGAKGVASYRLAQVESEVAALKRITYPADMAGQSVAAKKKNAMFEEIKKHVAEIVGYDSAEEIVGALVVLAEAYDHMGEALNSAPVPAGLTPEQVTQFKQGVAGLVEPFRAQAKEGLSTAIRRASDLESYGSYYNRAVLMDRRLGYGFIKSKGEKAFLTEQLETLGL